MLTKSRTMAAVGKRDHQGMADKDAHSAAPWYASERLVRSTRRKQRGIVEEAMRMPQVRLMCWGVVEDERR